MEVSFSLGQMFCARVWMTDARDALMSKKATNCHLPNFQENNYGHLSKNDKNGRFKNDVRVDVF